MKCTKVATAVSYVFTKEELESLKLLSKTIIYSNTNLKIDLKYIETENSIVIHDAGTRDEDVIVANWKERSETHDFVVDFNFADTIIDEKLQIPVTDDWYSLFNSAVHGRILAIEEAERSADKSKLVDLKNNPLYSADLLGKSYFIYQKFVDVTDKSGKHHKLPDGVYAKLASSVNLTDERIIEKIRPVQRMNDSWVCYGDAPNQKSHEHGHASRILKNKDMMEEYGIVAGDNAKVWELIEQRRIVPIYTLDVTIDGCAARSVQFIENILAENKYNPKFTKSNIIL